jgi:long-chain acyl-CoA synthetase
MKNETILRSVKETVEKANARVSSSEQIKKYVVLERDFQSELNEITPTMKLKRKVVEKNFKDVLEKLYE